jgi:hypothetical protein
MRRLAVIALALLALPVATADASPRQGMTFEAPRELLDDRARDVTLDEIRAFGVDRVRQLVYWKDFAPNPARRSRPEFDASNPDAYPAGTWARLDRLIAAAQARGISVQLTLTGPVPKWSTKRRRDQVSRPRPRHFRDFATAIGERFGGEVSMWSIWNEPNHPQFLGPQYKDGAPVSPRLYRRLYKAGHRGIRESAANAGDQILIAETSPRGNSNVVRPLRFLRGMLCLNRDYEKKRDCNELPADGYAHHAYTTRTGPRFAPPHRDDVTIGVLPRLVRALDRAGSAGVLPKGLDIFLTEFGIQTEPDDRSGVKRSKQPAYLAISEHIAYVNSRVAMFSQYLMSDDLPREEGYRFGGFESGLRRSDGRRKPGYSGFRLPLAVENYGGEDVLWGFVRPHRAETEVTIQAKRKGGKWRTAATPRTTSTGVYGLRADHRKGQRFRVRWTSPEGKRFTGPPIKAF